MAGYSGTPLPKKFGMKPGAALRVLNPPPAFFMQLGDLTATRFIEGEEGARAGMVASSSPIGPGSTAFCSTR